MVNVPRPEDVLLSHASRGDPSAFLTLLGPRLADAYGSLRESETPDDARDKLIELAAHLYRRLTGGRFRPPVDEWFSAESARVFPSLGQTAEAGAVSFDAELEQRLEQTIQREYSALLRKRGPSRRYEGAASRLLSRPGPLVAAGLALLLLVIALVLQPIWSRTGTRLELRLTTGERAYGVAFPFGSGVTQPSPAALSAEHTEDTADTAIDSARIDSVVQTDREEGMERRSDNRPSDTRARAVAPKPEPAPPPPPRPRTVVTPPPKPAPPPPPPPKPAPKPQPAPAPAPVARPQSDTEPAPAPSKPIEDESSGSAESSPAAPSVRSPETAAPTDGAATAEEEPEAESGLGDLDFSEWPSDEASDEGASGP